MMKQMVKAGAEKITLYKFKPLPLSAFEMFPPAFPAKKDVSSDKIERIARKLNTESKSNLLGKTIDVIVCKPVSGGRREGTISYPVSDGPVVLLSRQNIKQGKRLKVKIIEVLSDRLVKGELV
jgi:flagellar biosynthesis/type III secretory pathway ATPase